MSISFGSINTGLPKDIVKQLAEAERIPIRQMEVRKEKSNDKKNLVLELQKLVEKMRTDLETSRNATDFRELKVQTNDDLVDVTIDKKHAIPGNYQLEIEQLTRKSSAITNGVKDKNQSYLGVGFIQYTLPNGKTHDVYIDSANSSLEGIARVINRDEKMNMIATVVNDGSGSENPWRLILALKTHGDEFNANFPYFYMIDGEEDLHIDYEREAHDARIKLEGFQLELPENKLIDIIPGTTINLKKASPGEEFTINISEDFEATATKVDEIIISINAVLSFIKQQNTMDETTDTSRTLGGDSLLSSLESRIRTSIFQPVMTSAGPKRLSDIGIRFQRSGLLELDKKQFEGFVSGNYNTVTETLTGFIDSNGVKHNGVLNNLHHLATETLKMPNGILALRKKTFENNINDIDKRIKDKERLLSQKEKNLKDKFARLESTISQIRNQGAGLAGLSGATNFDPVNQLG